MGWMSHSLAAAARPAEAPRSGDYLTDGRELYCVEELFGDHALIEDCRNGALIDIGLEELDRLEPVKRARPVPVETHA